MTDRHFHRQAQLYRQRSRELTEEARHEFRDEVRRQYMLDQAATFQRVADAMVPKSPREALIEHLRTLR